MKKKIHIIFIAIIVCVCGIHSSWAASQHVIYAIDAKYTEHPWLGSPTSEYLAIANGYYRTYNEGHIYWSPATGAHEVHGSILLDRYLPNNGPEGILGFPKTDRLTSIDKRGKYSLFENGAIYYYPGRGSKIVEGRIEEKWEAFDREWGVLGYPMEDMYESDVPKSFSFEFGNIYGGNSVYRASYGPVYFAWKGAGETTGLYGAPAADPVYHNNVLSQEFLNGTISVDMSSVDLRPEIARRGIGIGNQGGRGTCSIFAMTFLLEYAYSIIKGPGYADLSEEYLNHVANIAAGNTGDGDFFSSCAAGYNEYGIVPESYWPYDKNWTYDFSSVSLDQATIDLGQELLTDKYQLQGYFQKKIEEAHLLTEGQFFSILTYLSRGIPLALGRHHSQALVGYEWDDSWSGGGFFIFKNSGGTASGDNGYRYESFQNVKDTACDVYVYEFPKNSMIYNAYSFERTIFEGENGEITLTALNNNPENYSVIFLKSNSSIIQVPLEFDIIHEGLMKEYTIYLNTSNLAPGVYEEELLVYYYFRVIGQVVLHRMPVTINVVEPYVDLVVSNLEILSFSNSSVSFRYTLLNNGTIPANLDGPSGIDIDNLTIQAFLSADTEYNAGDIPAGGTIIGVSPLGYLDPGETFTKSLTSGCLIDTNITPYLILLVDYRNSVVEKYEDNNTGYILLALNADIHLQPEHNTVALGQNAETEILITAAAGNIGAIDFIITYDPAIIRPDVNLGISGVENMITDYSLSVNSNNPGELILCAFASNATFPGDGTIFLKIHWLTIGTGTSNISFAAVNLIDSSITPYDCITTYDSTIVVQ